MTASNLRAVYIWIFAFVFGWYNSEIVFLLFVMGQCLVDGYVAHGFFHYLIPPTEPNISRGIDYTSSKQQQQNEEQDQSLWTKVYGQNK